MNLSIRHVKMPDASLVAEHRYCRGMPVTKTTVARQSVCELHCLTTPGCLFYNYKWDTGEGPILCHFADPLNGEVAATPDDALGWRVFYMNQ